MKLNNNSGVQHKKSSRGTEPIISSLILILIVVFAFSLVYGSYNSWTSAQRNGQLQQMQERAVVETVRFNSDTTASLYVFNVGDVEVKITQIQINQGSSEITPSSLSIMPGESNWINATYSTFTSGNAYTFKIITERGTIIETSAKY